MAENSDFKVKHGLVVSEDIELGHATDTTIARSSSGNISVEGNLIYRAGGTDIPVVDGGTGASNAGTARTNLGVDAAGTDNSTNVTLATVSGNYLSLSGQAITAGTVPVSLGGTNATTMADKAVIISQDSGTDTLAALALTTSGQLVIGGASGPAAATLSAGSNVTITNADGGITIASTDTTTNTQNEYATSWVDSSNDALLRLTESGAGSGTQDIKLVAGSNITLTPSGTDLTIAASGGGGGDMSDLIDDQTPQLYAGATLDTNSGNIGIDDAHGILDESGNEQLIFQTTGSATAYLQLYNATNDTTNTSTEIYSGPLLEATGSETHVGMRFQTKGRGSFTFTNTYDDNNHGPTLNLWRKNQSGLADDDAIGQVRFQAGDSSPANDDYGNARDYVKLKAYVTDLTDGTTDGRMDVNCIIADSQAVMAQFGNHPHQDDAVGVALLRGQMFDTSGALALSHDTHAGRYIRATAVATITLPANPTKGEQYIIINDSVGTTTIARNGNTINGATSDATITTRYEAKTFIATSSSAYIAIG